jgi:hypothetical protein
MSSLPQQLPLAQMQITWASQLNPVLSNLLVQGKLLTNIALNSGSNAVSHTLGRTPNGWFLVAPQGPATVYQASYQINPTYTLTLTSNIAVTTDIWVF